MFEVGKLTDESLDSFISELSKVRDFSSFAVVHVYIYHLNVLYRLDHKQKERLRDILNMLRRYETLYNS